MIAKRFHRQTAGGETRNPIRFGSRIGPDCALRGQATVAPDPQGQTSSCCKSSCALKGHVNQPV